MSELASGIIGPWFGDQRTEDRTVPTITKDERFAFPMVREPSIIADRKVRTPDEPALRLQGDLMDFWGERISAVVRDTRERRHPEIRKGEGLLMRGDTIYSYGTHFPMAEIHRRANGRAYRVLLNGDTYSGQSGWGHSTGGQQSSVRSIAARECKALDIEYIILPFSALDAAGIDRESIIPLDVKDDTTERRTRTSNERPGPLVTTDEETGVQEWAFQTRHGWHRECLGTGGDSVPVERDTPHAKYGQYRERVQVNKDPNRADVKDSFRQANWWPRASAQLQDDGTWQWAEERHRLGESLFKAKVRGELRRRAATDEETAQQLEAERYRHEVVRPAERALREAQDAVEQATAAMLFETRGRTNIDGEPIKAIATHAEIDRLKFWRSHRADVLAEIQAHQPRFPNVTVTEYEGNRRFSVAYTADRWAKFLSSYDYNEPHRPYFLCELRYRSSANTLEEAFEDLKPDEVREAERAGLEVLRQGDIFAIPVQDLVQLVALGETVKAGQLCRRSDSVRDALVHGTNHSATHVIHGTHGLEFGRGMLYHDPMGWGRTAEHRRVKLGDGKSWYRLVKNTVPLDKASGSSRGSMTAGGRLLAQSGQSRAWMLGGAVD